MNSIKKLAKDLLYARGNENLDISRLMSALGVITFLGASIWHAVVNRTFDAVAFGTGFAAVCAGCAGWIHMRQKHEGTE